MDTLIADLKDAVEEMRWLHCTVWGSRVLVDRTSLGSWLHLSWTFHTKRDGGFDGSRKRVAVRKISCFVLYPLYECNLPREVARAVSKLGSFQARRRLFE